MRNMFAPGYDRAKYIDRVQAETIAGLSERTVQEELGDSALSLAAMTENLYIPNIRDGVVTEPSEYRDTDNIPIVTISPGDRVCFEGNIVTLTGRQRQFIKDKGPEITNVGGLPYGATSLIQRINFDLTTDEALQPRRLADIDVQLGRAVSRAVGIAPAPEHQDRYPSLSICGRPIIILAQTYPDISSEILIHEMVHADRFDQDPVFQLDVYERRHRLWQEELIAYNISARYEQALLLTGKNRYLGKTGLGISMPVEEARALYVDKRNPFNPDLTARRKIYEKVGDLKIKPAFSISEAISFLGDI